MRDRIPLEFTCPKCGEHCMEEIQVEIIVASRIHLVQNADGSDPSFDYGEQTNDNGPNGHIDRYQCAGCGWTIIEDTVEYEHLTQDGLGERALIARIKELKND